MKKIIKIVTYFIIIFLFIFIGFSIKYRKDSSGYILGYRSFIILSDSMKPEFKSGDLIFVKRVNSGEIYFNDIISYTSRDPRIFGDIVTHRIVDIDYENNEFITRGDNADQDDEYPVTEELIIGKYVFSIPYIGYFFNFLKTDLGFVLLFITPLSILIITEIIHLLKLINLYKIADHEEIIKSKDEEMDNYKKQIEELNKKLSEKNNLDEGDQDL